MTGEQRILLVLEMSLSARELAKAQIRHDHPEWEKWQVDLEWFKIVFSPEPVPPEISRISAFRRSTPRHLNQLRQHVPEVQ